jgi:polyhydroxyalkanoate synthase
MIPARQAARPLTYRLAAWYNRSSAHAGHAAWREGRIVTGIEAQRAPERWWHDAEGWGKALANLQRVLVEDVPIEPTPKQPVWSYNKAVLYNYPVERPTDRPPILLVPWPAISRSFPFDLLPGRSFVEYLVKRGQRTYRIDWLGLGDYGPEDASLDFEYFIHVIHRSIDRVRRHSGAPQVKLLGYCLGVTLSSIYAALHPDRLHSLVVVAGPVDFADIGPFVQWTDERYFKLEQLIHTYGLVPAEFVRVGFQMLNPHLELRANVDLFENQSRDRFVEMNTALRKWSSDWIPFPGAFFRRLIRDLYQGNKLVKGAFTIHGQPVDLRRITVPVLAFCAQTDNIAPAHTTAALLEHVRSTVKEAIPVPGGHVRFLTGGSSIEQLWERVIAWPEQP